MEEDDPIPIRYIDFAHTVHTPTLDRLTSGEKVNFRTLPLENLHSLKTELLRLLDAANLRSNDASAELATLCEWQERGSGRGGTVAAAEKRRAFDHAMSKEKRFKDDDDDDSSVLGSPPPPQVLPSKGSAKGSAKSQKNQRPQGKGKNASMAPPQVKKNFSEDPSVPVNPEEALYKTFAPISHEFWVDIEDAFKLPTDETIASLEMLRDSLDLPLDLLATPPVGLHYHSKWSDRDFLINEKNDNEIASPLQIGFDDFANDFGFCGPLTQAMSSSYIGSEDSFLPTRFQQTDATVHNKPTGLTLSQCAEMERKVKHNLLALDLIDDDGIDEEENEVVAEINLTRKILQEKVRESQRIINGALVSIQTLDLPSLASFQSVEKDLDEANCKLEKLFMERLVYQRKQMAPPKQLFDMIKAGLDERDALIAKLNTFDVPSV